MKISDLKKLEKPFEVDLDGVVIKGTFRPSALTTDILERLAGLKAKDGDVEFAPTVLVEVLAALVASWDLTEDDGKKIVPTEEAIRQHIPPPYQRDMYDEIARRARPNRTSAAS